MWYVEPGKQQSLDKVHLQLQRDGDFIMVPENSNDLFNSVSVMG